jgi:uncharacterized protein (TIGR03083 family)
VTDSSTVRQVAQLCTDFLADSVKADWTVGVPELKWTVAETMAHVAESCLWYAIDFSAQGKDLGAVEHRVKTDVSPSDLIDTLAAYASVLAAVIDTAPSGAQGFHPMGMADASGFAAMACDEMLIHTDDAARGLGRSFDPEPSLAEDVLRRLFPWTSVDGDPWPLLLWSNGRRAVGDRSRLGKWRWHCAPLDEWNGEAPASVGPGPLA